MTESILDRLDADPGGARRYVAAVIAGGGTNAQVARALAKKFGARRPTTRSVSKWRNSDRELRALIGELEAAKRDACPDDADDPLVNVRPPVNLAQADADLFSLAIDVPEFGELMARDAERAEVASPVTEWGAPATPTGADDAEAGGDPPSDAAAVLMAEHGSIKAFAADCRRRLGNYPPHPA